MGGEPYRAAGITGKGQICGIADSGLNDLSCFFFDDSTSATAPSPLYATTPVHHGVLTNRSGIVEPFRRKVIQYIAYADMFDELGTALLHDAFIVAICMSKSLFYEITSVCVYNTFITMSFIKHHEIFDQMLSLFVILTNICRGSWHSRVWHCGWQ